MINNWKDLHLSEFDKNEISRKIESEFYRMIPEMTRKWMVRLYVNTWCEPWYWMCLRDRDFRLLKDRMYDDFVRQYVYNNLAEVLEMHRKELEYEEKGPSVQH